MTHPKLDRIPYFDERSRQYPMRALLPATVTRRSACSWRPGTILDQGSEGACVGFGWAQEALMSPVRVNFEGMPPEMGLQGMTPNAVARTFYVGARIHDRAMGNHWAEGASVLAGAKVMTEFGLLREYRWCFDITDIIRTLIHHGPVVLGIPWHESMYDTTPAGELRVSGRQVGGHCIVASGYHPAKILHPSAGPARPMIRLTNSWGPDWGHSGQAWIDVPTLAALLADNGEACVPVHRAYGRSAA